MANRSVFDLVKSGFWFGIGLIVPLAFAIAGATYLAYTAMYSSSVEDYQDTYDSYLTGDDVSKVVLGEYRQTMQGKQLLINGSFTNTHEAAITSLEIEAELFDEKGEFVYECRKSIYRSIDAGVVENFQIKCGCSENGIPTFKSIEMKVVKVN